MKMYRKLLFLTLVCAFGFSTRFTAAQEKKDETEINLDELEEEGEDEAGDGEALLPVSGTMIEVERHPALMVLILVVLVPAAALLFRPKRVRKRRSAPINQGNFS